MLRGRGRALITVWCSPTRLAVLDVSSWPEATASADRSSRSLGTGFRFRAAAQPAMEPQIMGTGSGVGITLKAPRRTDQHLIPSREALRPTGLASWLLRDIP